VTGTRLSFGTRHGYGVAAASLAIGNAAMMFFLLKFLTDQAGIPPETAGWILLVGKAWDAVTDPLVGRLSDRTRSRMGQRRAWIAGGSLPFLLFYAAVWWGLPLQGSMLAVGYGVLLILYNTCYTTVVVPYGALTPVLTEDYDERTRLNGARMIWSMVGGIAVAAGIPIIANASWGSWRLAGVIMAAVALPGLAITLWVTRGRDRQVATPSTAGMWSVLRNRAFRRTAGLFLAAWSIIATLSMLVPYYVEYHLHHKELLDVMLAAIQGAALLAIPLVVVLSGRVEKHIAYAVSVGLWAVVLLNLARVPLGTGWPVMSIAVLTGFGVAAAHVLPWSMLPDVIEADKVATGQDRAGAFYGVMTFLEKCTTAVALWVVAQVLGWAGYMESTGDVVVQQPESARIAILVLVGPVPGVILLAAALAAWRWPPMTRAQHAELVSKIRGAD